VDIIGIALATKPVYVNGELAYRKGEYFRKELSVNNASGPVWQQVTVTASGEPTVTGNLFVPRTPEPFIYDLDGNMTSDGRWNYTWDAENRLVKVESRSDTPQTSWRRVEWQYDALGRRIRQITSDGSSGTWVVAEDLKLVSDPTLFGRHVIELNATNVVVRTYVWGLDLSGSLDGAGGVGGLLWVTLHTASGPAAGTHFAAYDGNGNIVALSAASDGSETALYEYGPFAEPIRITGPAANQNPFRFSTKRTDSTTDLVLYEYRVYQPSMGRWLSRDPVEERVGENLMSFLRNDPIPGIDPLGLYNWGTVGDFRITKEGSYTRTTIKGSWFMKRPGDGDPCCEPPACATGRRIDKGGGFFSSSITMQLELAFTNGTHKELIVLWNTCYLPDYTVGIRTNCNNKLVCEIPTVWWPNQWGCYLTSAMVSFLSCEKGKWTTKVLYFNKDYK